MRQQILLQKISSFASGDYIIDLVSDDPPKGPLKLVLWNGSTTRTASRFTGNRFRQPNSAESISESRRVAFEPVDVNASVRDAMRFPSGVAEFGSSRQLVDEICKSIQKYTHLSESSVLLASLAGLSSWFPEALSSPISLAIYGPPCPQRYQLFYVLSCIYRRTLLLSEISLGALCSLPLDLSPSVFIEHFDHTRRMERGIRATFSQGFFPSRRELVRTSCMTVFCTDEPITGASFPDWNIVEIPVTHTRAAPPLLTRQARNEIANRIQPKLLMYRLKSYKQVMGSTFDATPLKPPIQELVRGLGACIVDDPERQTELVRLLKGKEERTLQEMSWDARVTVLEALLALCHEPKRESVYVGEITIAANEILQGRGEMLEMTSRTVGSKLRSLGLGTSRLDSSGRGFLLTNETRKRVHRLAYDHRIEFQPTWKERCDHCVELEGEETINKEADWGVMKEI